MRAFRLLSIDLATRLICASISFRTHSSSTPFWNSLDGHSIGIYTYAYTATSNAPQIRIGRKRRLSTPEPDGEHERDHTPASKKLRAESEADATTPPATPVAGPGADTEEVKEVTEGVKEVELEEKPSTTEEMKNTGETSGEAQEAAAVPLPDSPQLKAAEAEDADADGEPDTDVDAEGEVDAKATEIVPSAMEGAATLVGKVEESSATTAVADDEIPGLTFPSTSPKKMETPQVTVLTAQA